KGARVADETREPGAGEEVGIERHYDVGGLEIVLGVVIGTEGHLRAGARAVTMHRVPAMPLRLREELLDGLQLRTQRRRADRSRQEAKTGAAVALVVSDALLHLNHELAPGLLFAHVSDYVGAVGIVEVVDGSLSEEVGGAEAAAMLGIALDLGGTKLMGLDQQRMGVSGEGHRRCVKDRLAGYQFLRLANIRKDLLQRLLGASGQTGQRHGRAGQLQEAAPGNRINPFRMLPRNLALQQLAKGSLMLAGQLFQGPPVLRSGGAGKLLAHVVQLATRRLDLARRNQFRV